MLRYRASLARPKEMSKGSKATKFISFRGGLLSESCFGACATSISHKAGSGCSVSGRKKTVPNAAAPETKAGNKYAKGPPDFIAGVGVFVLLVGVFAMRIFQGEQRVKIKQPMIAIIDNCIHR